MRKHRVRFLIACARQSERVAERSNEIRYGASRRTWSCNKVISSYADLARQGRGDFNWVRPDCGRDFCYCWPCADYSWHQPQCSLPFLHLRRTVRRASSRSWISYLNPAIVGKANDRQQVSVQARPAAVDRHADPLL